ncbi:MAG: hypothetical protein ACYC5M_04725 [Anaerolineae bacterium]
MKRSQYRWMTVLAALLAGGLIAPRPALAYLDPGTGSYLFQVAMALIVGALFAIKLFWSRIKAFFQKLTQGDKHGTRDF